MSDNDHGPCPAWCDGYGGKCSAGHWHTVANVVAMGQPLDFKTVDDGMTVPIVTVALAADNDIPQPSLLLTVQIPGKGPGRFATAYLLPGHAREVHEALGEALDLMQKEGTDATR